MFYVTKEDYMFTACILWGPRPTYSIDRWIDTGKEIYRYIDMPSQLGFGYRFIDIYSEQVGIICAVRNMPL